MIPMTIAVVPRLSFAVLFVAVIPKAVTDINRGFVRFDVT